MSTAAEYIWQDREIRFDVPFSQLSMRKGEMLIDSINSVEDTKGNNGDKGNLLITNLRLIWFADNNQKINLFIAERYLIRKKNGSQSRVPRKTQHREGVA